MHTRHPRPAGSPLFVPLYGTLKDYDWGSVTLLADLQGREPTGRPEAELWFGTHPQGTSTVPAAGTSGDTTDQVPLTQLTGGTELPHLTKLLAAARALSIQAHPTTEQAQAGFAAEERAGIPVDATHRCYPDPHHKPEMLIALTDFVALCGFRHPAEAAMSLRRIAYVLTEYQDDESGTSVESPIAETLTAYAEDLTDADGIRSVFTRFLDPDGPWVTGTWIRTIIDALTHSQDHLDADDHLATMVSIAADHPDDPGLLVSLLLNRLDIARGQAIFMPAGQVHAYVSGLGFEVMAASNNVLRGGLTSKHIDVAELNRIVSYEPVSAHSVFIEPDRTRPEDGVTVSAFTPPVADVDDFAVRRVDFTGSDAAQIPVADLDLAGHLIVVCVNGAVELEADPNVNAMGTESPLRLSPGQAAVIPAYSGTDHATGQKNAAPVALKATEAATVFLTGLPPSEV